MKKITLVTFLLLITGLSGFSQCIATSQYPAGDVSSENDGSLQQITDCNYAGEYAVVINLVMGNDYQFTSTGGAGNYLTVTDGANTVLGTGTGTVTITNISTTTIRLHIFNSSGCDTEDECRETTVQCISASCVPPPPPANDECANAVSLTVDSTFCNGSTTNGSNENATDSGIAAATCFSYGENDVWYSFVVPVNTATVDVSTDFTGGTLVDTEVALYSGTCGTLAEVNCDQDGGITILSNGSSWNSLISNVAVTAGQTYYVRVSGYSDFDEGTFCLRIATNQTLAAETFEMERFTAYPNPVKDVLHLSYSSEMKSVSIFNMLGQEVLTKELHANEGQLNTSELSSGNYLVKVMIGETVKTFKIVKQ